MAFETVNVDREGAVLFAEIAAPPMNLLGPELVRDLVALIQQAEADDSLRVLVFKSADPEYFISHVDVGAHHRVPAEGGEADRRTFDRPPVSASERKPPDHNACVPPRLKARSRPR
jgi:enoyl-CoA hydratase/carnithine racemase